ncbi:MAG: methyltransferase domain-containing protein [Propionibacteriales bacterium]|nr:methyltransferase domain-containing protein [Propionibacteriales bacterium]
MADTDSEERARRLAADSLAANDATSWFERLYVAAEARELTMPWDRGAPHHLLVQWAEEQHLEGRGRRALIVGCGLGQDAEYVQGLGFDTVAFDVSAAGVRTAHRRFPDSGVQYVTADLLDPRAEWRAAFDLVVESLTVQSLPESLRPAAIAAVARLVRPGGTLIVIAAVRDELEIPVGPPWPLTRADVEAFATEGLQPVRIEDIRDAKQRSVRRWRAEFAAPSSA